MSHIHHTGNGPRVHDFRHTFAVHTLEKQLAEGYDPMIIVPRLAAYLGHKSYRETCWYIHLTIASFPELAQKLDSVCYNPKPKACRNEGISTYVQYRNPEYLENCTDIIALRPKNMKSQSYHF